MFEMMIKYSQGNPGALTFLMQLVNPSTPIPIVVAVQVKLDAIPSLKGTKGKVSDCPLF